MLKQASSFLGSFGPSSKAENNRLKRPSPPPSPHPNRDTRLPRQDLQSCGACTAMIRPAQGSRHCKSKVKQGPSLCLLTSPEQQKKKKSAEKSWLEMFWSGEQSLGVPTGHGILINHSKDYGRQLCRRELDLSRLMDSLSEALLEDSNTGKHCVSLQASRQQGGNFKSLIKGTVVHPGNVMKGAPRGKRIFKFLKLEKQLQI